MTKLKYKKRFILITIILVLIIARIVLPEWIRHTINKNLDTLENYTGKVKDVDLSLFTGDYYLRNFNIDEESGGYKTPFIFAKDIHVTLDWKALLKGRILSDLTIDSAEVNYVIEEQKNITDSTDLVAWFELAQRMMPININQLKVNNAAIHYKDFFNDQPIDLKLDSIYVKANNLSNVINDKDSFPANVTLNSRFFETGRMRFTSELNVLKNVPDMDLDLTIEDVDITNVNQVFEKYLKFDFATGYFNNYLEFKIYDGAYLGYVKPIFKNVNVYEKEQDKNDKPIQKIIELAGEVSTSIFSNPKKEQLALKVPFEGKMEKLSIQTFFSIKTFLKNAFFEALKPTLDKEINTTTDELPTKN